MVLLNRNPRKQQNSIVSSQMCSLKSEHNQVPLLDRSAPFMEDVVVTKEGVTKLLKGLNPSKALVRVGKIPGFMSISHPGGKSRDIPGNT